MTQILLQQGIERLALVGGAGLALLAVYIYTLCSRARVRLTLGGNGGLLLLCGQGMVWMLLSLLGLAGWFTLSRTFAADMRYLPRQAYYLFLLPLIACVPPMPLWNRFAALLRKYYFIAVPIGLALSALYEGAWVISPVFLVPVCGLSLMGKRTDWKSWVLAALILVFPIAKYNSSCAVLLKMGYGLIFLLRFPKLLKILTPCFVGGLLLCSFLLPQIPKAYELTDDPNTKFRLGVWADEAAAIVDTYGVGVGFGTVYASEEFRFPADTTTWDPATGERISPHQEYRADYRYTQDQRAYTTGSHNTFVSLTFRLGVLGLGLFLWFLLQIWRKALRQPEGLLAACTFLFCGTLLAIAVNVGLESPKYLIPFLFCFLLLNTDFPPEQATASEPATAPETQGE